MEAIIGVKNISKIYFKDKKCIEALKGINLTIEKGDFLTILGPSGAGKSTLLHILGALDKPTEGEVIFENNRLGDIDEDIISLLRNRRIGFIFQFHHLLPEFTALENVMMPGFIGRNNREEVLENATKILKDVGLEDRLNHYPGELSGGEEQRVAVARALINKPSVLFADEPTGDVDSENGEKILGILSKYNKEIGLTVVVVTHNKEIAKMGTREVNIEDGKII